MYSRDSPEAPDSSSSACVVRRRRVMSLFVCVFICVLNIYLPHAKKRQIPQKNATHFPYRGRRRRRDLALRLDRSVQENKCLRCGRPLSNTLSACCKFTLPTFVILSRCTNLYKRLPVIVCLVDFTN